MTHALVTFVQAYGLLAVFLLMAAESCGVPFPSEVIMPFAGAFAALGHLSLAGRHLCRSLRQPRRLARRLRSRRPLRGASLTRAWTVGGYLRLSPGSRQEVVRPARTTGDLPRTASAGGPHVHFLSGRSEQYRNGTLRRADVCRRVALVRGAGRCRIRPREQLRARLRSGWEGGYRGGGPDHHCPGSLVPPRPESVPPPR